MLFSERICASFSRCLELEASSYSSSISRRLRDRSRRIAKTIMITRATKMAMIANFTTTSNRPTSAIRLRSSAMTRNINATIAPTPPKTLKIHNISLNPVLMILANLRPALEWYWIYLTPRKLSRLASVRASRVCDGSSRNNRRWRSPRIEANDAVR